MSNPFSDEDYKRIEQAHDLLKFVVENYQDTCPKNKAVKGLYNFVLQLGGLVLEGKMLKALRNAPGRVR